MTDQLSPEKSKELQVQDVILHLTQDITLPENTVDQLITGSADQVITGIVVTFMPTQHVIEQAIQQGANLIIAHESPFTTIIVLQIGLRRTPFIRTKET